ncbi:MAG: polysaccharide deacetylase family protein [Planctomycetes bacterium]|nr:polysaccharide deacetylase family protein [Planctomycetota bacterium]
MVQATKNAVKAAYSGALWHSGALAAWLRVRPGRCRPWILNYHHIAPAAFEDHLRCLVRRYRIVTLDACVAALASGEPLPPNAVAITFDDGYQQVYTELFPLLAKYEAPATVFVPTTPVDTEQLLWFNTVKGWVYNKYAKEGASLRLGDQEFPLSGGPETAYVAVMRHLNTLSVRQRDAVLATRLEDEGTVLYKFLDWYRPLTWDQMRAMQGLVTFGGHTRTHPWLSRLSRAEAEDEILGSKARLEEMLGTPVRHFAYPFGSPDSFTEETVEVLKAGGFVSAATTSRGPCRAGVSPFALPRILFDGSVGGKAVAARLSGLWLFVST